MTNIRLNLIVAVSQNGGIGCKGALPWRLKKEMAYFNRISSSVTNKNRQNVVIMGRLTWESLPLRFRPLADRINIVLSNTLPRDTSFESGCAILGNLKESLKFISESLSDKVEEVFIIGGVSLYKEALESENSLRLYYTRIFKDFECDTFFPVVNWDRFNTVDLPNVDKEMQVEGDIKYRFEVYDSKE